jgi:hypothetical protein
MDMFTVSRWCRHDVAQCLIADADTSKFWISLYKTNGKVWHIIHVYISKIDEKDEFSMKFAIWAPKKRQNGKKKN